MRLQFIRRSGMERFRRSLTVLALVSLFLLPPLRAEAQQGRPSLDVRLGVANPKGDLGDIHDEGIFAGVGLGYRISSRLELRFEGGSERLQPGGRPDILGGFKGPRADLWHLTALALLELTEPTATRWEVDAGVGAGTTFFDIEESETVEARTGQWFTLQSAALVGFNASQRANLFVRIDGYLMLEDTPEPEGYLSKEISLIISAGLRIRI